MQELQLPAASPSPQPIATAARPPPAAPPSTLAGCTSQDLVDGLATACQALDIPTAVDRLRVMHAQGMLYALEGADGVGRQATSGLSPLQIVGRGVESERSRFLLQVLLLFAQTRTSEDRLPFERDVEACDWAKSVAQSFDRGRSSTAVTTRHLLQLDNRPALTAWLEQHLSPSPSSPPGPPVPPLRPHDLPHPPHPPTPSPVVFPSSTSPDALQHDASATSSLLLVEVQPPPPLEVNVLASLVRPARALDRLSSMQPEIRLACEKCDEADDGVQGSSAATFSGVGRTDVGERAPDPAAGDSPAHADTVPSAPTLAPPPCLLASPARDLDASTLSPAADNYLVKLETDEQAGDNMLEKRDDELEIKLEERSPSPAPSLSDMELESSQEQECKENTPIAARHEDEDVDIKPFVGVERTARSSPDQSPFLVKAVCGPASPSDSPAQVGLGITGVALGPSTSRIPRLALPPPPAAPRSASPSDCPAPLALSPILPPVRPAPTRRKQLGAGAGVPPNQIPLGPLAPRNLYPTPEFSPPPLALPLAATPRSPPSRPPAVECARPASPPLAVAAAAAVEPKREPEPEWVNPFAGPFGHLRHVDDDPPRAHLAPKTAASPAPRSSLNRRSSTDAASGEEAAAASARAQVRRLGVRWAEPEMWVVGSGAGPPN
ncbi:uncharacterized protein RHOBADRAFT_47466 [Rhodotorula graminis WP1]|uniref:Uncharacterized protein n=1 Tax=Rhodotorula graminis (strain WP1) TaxID=578459 RepID=A0A0P9EQI5_RHOGW|nr:uncharacterized protein RHOBADRAFT_47466 [Rhodotorula graminis WP1]KPV71762.1 hypothetical protein RHOBADRAFT_47466 [Rhodotorula graminis WP1]